MMWAHLFCMLPWLAIAGALSHWLLQLGDDRVVATLASIVIGLLWIPGIPGGMISVGMLSLANRHFFRGVLATPIR